MTCRGQKTIDRLFVDGLGPWRWRRLRRHMAGCQACREYYERVALVWRAMGPGAVPDVVVEAMAEEVIAGLRPPLRSWAWRGKLMLASAGLAVVVSGAGLATWLSHRPPSTEWGERGTTASRLRGVRAFCLGTADGGDRLVRGSATAAVDGRQAVAVLRCRRDESIQFAYTLGDGPGEHLLLFAVAPDGHRLWYTPAAADPPQAAALVLEGGRVDEPLPDSLRLAVRHQPGEHAVHALFLDRAVTRSEAETLLGAGVPLPGLLARQQLTLVVE